jgi:ubiquitin-like domain-containing CTD phosphatase 1
MITDSTNILPLRQKLLGLSTIDKSTLSDSTLLSALKLPTKKTKALETLDADGNPTRVTPDLSFTLMGTPETELFVDPIDKDDCPEVIDDFDLDYNAGSEEWAREISNSSNLAKFTASTEIFLMSDLREGKPLLVLDLDHTLLDFSSKALTANDSDRNRIIAAIKRPYMDAFMTEVYKHYDICVWSQTSWRWLECKLTELNMVHNPNYKIAFVLDKTSMFKVTSTTRTGEAKDHSVKPLQIVWSKYPQYSSQNTIHIDDLTRNFALNPHNGVTCTGYYRKKREALRDVELVALAAYLTRLASEVVDFATVDHRGWREVAAGTSEWKGAEEAEDSGSKRAKK